MRNVRPPSSLLQAGTMRESPASSRTTSGTRDSRRWGSSCGQRARPGQGGHEGISGAGAGVRSERRSGVGGPPNDVRRADGDRPDGRRHRRPAATGSGHACQPASTSVTCDDGVAAVGHRDASSVTPSNAAPPSSATSAGGRIAALDILRGRRDPRHARQQRLDLHRARRPRGVDLRRLRHGGSGAAGAAGAGQRQVPRAADPAVRGGAGAAVPVHGAARPALAGPVRAARRDPVRRGPGALRRSSSSSTS